MNVFQKTMTDQFGNALNGVVVTVYLLDKVTQAPAIYNADGSSLANPFSTLENGKVEFAAPSMTKYWVHVQYSGLDDWIFWESIDTDDITGITDAGVANTGAPSLGAKQSDFNAAVADSLYEIDGTPNQVSATVSGKIITLALPNALIAPGSVQASGQLSGMGTGTNDDASAGQIGEVISSSVASGSAVALTTAVVANVTSINLTPGDWEVDGQVDYHDGTNTTIVTYMMQCAATSASSLSATADFNSTVLLGNKVPVDPQNAIPRQRRTVPASVAGGFQTIYLNAKASFTTGPLSAYGTIWARRVR